MSDEQGASPGKRREMRQLEIPRDRNGKPRPAGFERRDRRAVRFAADQQHRWSRFELG